jgi:hypothetical protein
VPSYGDAASRRDWDLLNNGLLFQYEISVRLLCAVTAILSQVPVAFCLAGFFRTFCAVLLIICIGRIAFQDWRSFLHMIWKHIILISIISMKDAPGADSCSSWLAVYLHMQN